MKDKKSIIPNNKKQKSSINIPRTEIKKKKLILNTKENPSSKKISYTSKHNELTKINSLNTFNKIILLQNLLNNLTSVKNRFEGIYQKTINKIQTQSFNYFKYKIYMKEIFDYCLNNNPEQQVDYELIKEPEKYIDKFLYKSIYDFLFLIRNNNNILLNMINYFDKYIFSEISDFFINFFYENTIKSSFVQEELELFIFLLLEDVNIKKIPNDIIPNYNNLYIYYVNESFLFHVFKALTRKIDVRNYIYRILNDIIIKMENYRNPLDINIHIVNRFLHMKDSINLYHSFIIQARKYSDDIAYNKPKSNKNFADYDYKYIQTKNEKGSMQLKRANKIEINEPIVEEEEKKELITIDDIINGAKNIGELIKNKIKKELKIKKKDTKINDNNNSNKIMRNIDINMDIMEPLDDDNFQKIKQVHLDPFFNEINTTLEYISQKYDQYSKTQNKSSINLMMKNYLGSILKQTKLYFKKKGNVDEQEIYSTIQIKKELRNIRKIKEVESFKNLMEKIKLNYKIITIIIWNIIDKIKDNIIAMPIILKFIITSSKTFFRKKNSIIEGNTFSEYKISLFGLNFLFCNVILQNINNTDFNGLITTDILSQITKDNLKLINDILYKAISGELFNNNDEPYMALFNNFIIEIMPKLFEIIENINYELKDNIIKLIEEKNNNERKINYNFFENNKDEFIQYQNICFTWENVYMLIKVLEKNKNVFIDNNKNIDEKNILKNILDNKEIIKNFFANGVKNKIFEYFIISKLNYSSDFQKKFPYLINPMNKTNRNANNEFIYIYKKILSELLSYMSEINKDDFFRLNEHSHDDDLDFKERIIPQIIYNIKSEMNFNYDDIKNQQIIFYCNYLILNINNIPKEYKKNNYSHLLNELINETQKNIKIYKNRIISEIYLKFKESQKINFILSNINTQIRQLERLKCIEYLYDKLTFSNKFNIQKDNDGVISNISYDKKTDTNINDNISIIEYLSNKAQHIISFITAFPDFNKYQDDKFTNILDIEEKAKVPQTLENYFNQIKNMTKKDIINKRFNQDEVENLISELQNFILGKIYHKLFPLNKTKDDIFFYNKCHRLSFIKSHNVMTMKFDINHKLMNTIKKYIDEMDEMTTPVSKIQNFGKVLDIIKNYLIFYFGKKELGIDDFLKPLTYVLIKSEPKKICSNYQFCEMYLTKELSKQNYGLILAQIDVVMKFIQQMKYNDLINVSEEQFGKDEI